MKRILIICALLISVCYAQTNSGVFVVGGKAINVGDGIPNIFLATQSAFWNNANNWSLGRLPVTNQNVVIRANCTVDVSFTVKSLTVESTRTLSFNPFTGTVNNDFICNGNLNQSGFSSNLILNGANNSIAGTFTPGTTSTITYNRAGTQDVLNLPYNFLMFSQGGAAITRNLNAGVFFIKNSLTLGGTPSTTTINKADGADITFEGLLGLGNFTTLTTIGNVIIQNGIRAQATNATINCSTLIVRAISQQSFLNSQQGVFVNGNFLIENGLTFTNNFGNSFGVAGLNVSGSINGSNASSTFINNGYLVLNSLGSLMNTGVFTNNSGSTIQLSYAGTSNIPNYTYHNLWLSNTGTKSLSLNTTVNDLITSTNGILNIGNFDLTVNGIALIQGNNVVESLSTTGTGKLICVGQLQGNNFSMVNIGSNTIECRGGISTVQATSITLKSPVLFTTNNQNIQSTNGTDTRPVIFTNSVQSIHY